MKSDLIGQALQRYTDSGLLRARPLRQEAVLLTTTIAAVVAETDNAYKDRVDKYNTKVYKSRTYILDNCDPQIADYYAKAYDTATALQDYLLNQFGKASISQEYLIYLEQDQITYNSRDLEKFCKQYRSKLIKLNKIKDFKVSKKHSLFRFLSLVGEYFLQFTANMRQDIRKNEAGTIKGTIPIRMTLTQCITDLLDEYTT